MGSPAASSVNRTSQLLKERVRALHRQLPGALAGDEKAIHQMRVAGRRLRVALPLLARKPEGRRLRGSLKRVRELVRTAGTSRDLDVSLALFEQRLREGAPPGPASLALRRRLRAARTRGRRAMAEALLDLDLAALRRDLRKIVARGGEGLFAAFSRLREERDAQSDALVRGLEELGERYDPERLHRLRIRARRLRYLAELCAVLKDQTSEAPALFKELQDRLGGIHDAHVLAQWVARQAERDEKHGRSELAAECRREVLALHELSASLHATLLQCSPLALVHQALEAMGLARSAA